MSALESGRPGLYFASQRAWRATECRTACAALGSEAIMRKWLRRIRGAIGMGITWGVAWAGAGTVLAVVTRFRADAAFPLVFGVLGFIAGVIFSALLALIEGGRRLDQMSLPRFAGWGAIGGLLLSALFAEAASLGGGGVLAVAPPFPPALAGGAPRLLGFPPRGGKGGAHDEPCGDGRERAP